MRWSEPEVLFGVVMAGIAGSAAATAWARAHARRNGLLDAPGERRSHAVPTPRGGGIGIVLVALFVSAWLGWREGGVLWWCVSAGLSLVAGAGWWDDHRPLPAWPRLLAHIAAGACLAVGLWMQGAEPATVTLAFLLVPVLVNVWNFIDGIDGLAASQALLAALGLVCILSGPGQLLALAVAAACAGFLPFNLPKARIFLGDVGSGALGFLLAALIAMGSEQRMPWSWPLLLLPVAACAIDSSLTLLWRASRGEPWWRPHVQHLYQRLARRFGHPAVTMLYAGWTTVAIALMLTLLRFPVSLGWMGMAVFVVLSSGAWWRLHRGFEDEMEGIGR
jgi:UDP-N-acetylmuramyl pentapeptide phosphotransferase/UDP-N-acetylglucosamine-1-phosphate transferase